MDKIISNNYPVILIQLCLRNGWSGAILNRAGHTINPDIPPTNSFGWWERRGQALEPGIQSMGCSHARPGWPVHQQHQAKPADSLVTNWGLGGDELLTRDIQGWGNHMYRWEMTPEGLWQQGHLQLSEGIETQWWGGERPEDLNWSDRGTSLHWSPGLGFLAWYIADHHMLVHAK